MRIARLSLHAFGPFSDVVLDFGPDGRGFHVVYGQNEAGKSTALRAIAGLYYGIPVHTPDAHRFGPRDLRVGALLVRDDGTRLDVVRRKGRAKTLETPAGDLVDEAPLRAMLGGVGQELFGTLFGLDHVTLRQGADALLRGRGHVGESIYEAGVGIAGVAGVLAELRAEAEALYTPLARKKPVSEALKAYADAKKRCEQDTVSATAYAGQERGIEEARSEVGGLERQARHLRAELQRKRRAQRMLPLAAQWREASARRTAIGEVPMLPDTARAERAELQRTVSETAAKETRLALEAARLDAHIVAVGDELGPAVPDPILDDLVAAIALHRRNQGELADERAALALVTEDALAILRRLPAAATRPATLDDVDDLQIDAGLQARIAAIGAELGAARKQSDERTRSIAQATAERLRVEQELAATPAATGRGELERAAAAATRADDLARIRREADAERARLEAEADVLRRGLDPLPPGDVGAIADLALPTADAIRPLEQGWIEVERRRAGLEDEARRIEDDERRVARDLDALRAGADVPSEADLAEARAERDRRLDALLDAGQGEPDAVREALRGADRIADRLRREAGRVAERASLEADRNALAGERRVNLERRAEADERARALAAATRTAFGGSGLDLDEAARGRAFLERHALLRQRVEASRAAQARAAAASGEEETLVAALASTLAAAQIAYERDEGAPALRRRALGAIEALQRVEAARADLVSRDRELARHLDRLRAELEVLAGERGLLERTWSEAAVALHLPPTTTTEEALAVLAEQQALFRKVDEARRRRARERELDAGASRFAETIGAWVRTYAPDLANRPPLEAATLLSVRLTAARAQRGEQTKRIAEREAIERERRGNAERGALAAGRLDELLAAAGAADVVELERVEARALEAARLDQALAAVAARMAAAGDGLRMDELLAEVEGVSPDELEAEIEDAEQKLDDVERERDRAHQTIGSREAGLAAMSVQRGGADAATDAQAHLADVASLARRHMVTSLAAAILAREIERYREAHQGPVLRRAGELFARLTRGRYIGLRAEVGDDDELEIRCIRHEGTNVDTSGLSDGTRDQLYLALRISTLEGRLEEGEAMPLVLDDILIHFDDDRARAALEVLGELSGSMQILFFTHHHRLVELAREVVPEVKLHEQVLPASAVTAGAGATSPR